MYMYSRDIVHGHGIRDLIFRVLYPYYTYTYDICTYMYVHVGIRSLPSIKVLHIDYTIFKYEFRLLRSKTANWSHFVIDTSPESRSLPHETGVVYSVFRTPYNIWSKFIFEYGIVYLLFYYSPKEKIGETKFAETIG
jgi:hypothetical protein